MESPQMARCKWEIPLAGWQEWSWLQEKEGENLMFCRLGSRLVTARQWCVWRSQSLGTKLGQYTLSDLNSLLDNSLSYGSAKWIRLFRLCKKGFSSTRFPYSEGGGNSSLCTRYEEKYSPRNWYVYVDCGNISAISGKACTDKGRVNIEPEASEMAQKWMGWPIEWIPAYNALKVFF